MSHVPVYQTRRIQLSPHLLLSQSFFLYVAFLPPPCHTRTPPFLVERPDGEVGPTGASLSLPSNTFIARSRQTLLWLHDSFAERPGKARMALTAQCAALISGPS